MKKTENILERINKAGLKLLVPLKPQETYATIVREALKLADGDNASVVLDDNGILRRVYSSSPKFMKVPIRQRGFHYQAFIKQKAFVLHEKDFKKILWPVRQEGFKSDIFIPLSYKDKAIGVLNVRSKKEEHFSKKELDILKLFGSMASLAIRKAQLYDETKTALELRDSFISLAAHELRTPLTSIHGYIQLLHGRLAKSETTESRWVQELLLQSNRLTNLIKDLLEVNRLKAGHFQIVLQECRLISIMARALQKLTVLYPNYNIAYKNTLSADEDIVIGDCMKLEQAIGAILDNAAKFSSSGSQIHIVLERKKDMLYLKITDEGIGIAAKDLQHVFDGFYKGVENLRQGMGVGLMLAKYIIQQHRGRITLASEVGKGTTFVIALPQHISEEINLSA